MKNLYTENTTYDFATHQTGSCTTVTTRDQNKKGKPNNKKELSFPTPESLLDKEGAIPINKYLTGVGRILAPPREWDRTGPPVTGVPSNTTQAHQLTRPQSVINSKPNYMKTLYFNQMTQQLTGRTTETKPLFATGHDTDKTPKNSLRQNAARILISLILLLVMQGMALADNATWSLNSSPGNPTTSGNISATALAKGSGVGTVNYGTDGAYCTGWSSTSRNNSDYFEYTITPVSGYNLSISNISFYHRKSSFGTDNGSVYYSTDNFSNSTQLGSNFSIGNSQVQFSNTTTIPVTSGTTLTIRVYAWGLSTNESFYNETFVIT